MAQRREPVRSELYSWSRSPLRQHAALTALLVAISWPAMYLARRFFEHAPQPAYVIPASARAIVISVLLAIVLAALLGFVTTRGIVAALAAIATVSLFFGVLFTLLGLPLLGLGALAAFGAIRFLRESPGVRSLLAAASGIVLGGGFAFLVIVGTHPPLVDCRTNTTTVTYWFWGGSPSRSSGSSTSTPDGTQRGSVSFDGRTYQYVCTGDALTSFNRVD